MKIDVVLSASDVEWCQQELKGRQERAAAKNRQDAHGCKGLSYEKDLAGVMAELAVSRWSGEPMLSGDIGPLYDDKTKRQDVGEDIQVRSTIVESGCLLIHDNEPAHHRAVACIVILRRRLVEIRGWQGIGAIQDQPQKYYGALNSDMRKCYCVPQSELLSMKLFRCKNQPNVGLEAAQTSLW